MGACRFYEGDAVDESGNTRPPHVVARTQTRAQPKRRRHLLSTLNMALIVTLLGLWLSSVWLHYSIHDHRKSENRLNFYLSSGQLTIMFPNPYWGGLDPDRWVQWSIRPFLFGVEPVSNFPGWNRDCSGGLPAYRADREGGANRLLVPIWSIILPLVGLHFVMGARRRGRHSIVCRSCGYDLTGNVSGRCSECGAPMETRQCEDRS